MADKIFSFDFADVVFKDGILWMDYKDVAIELDQAKLFVAKLMIELADVLPILLLSDISKHKNMKKEVRDYLGGPEIFPLMKANAIVANSILSKLIVNLYLSFNKPPIPTKMFTNKDAAVLWLQQFRK